MEFKIGDKVLASRKMKGSNSLSTATHTAVIVAMLRGANSRSKSYVTLKYESSLGPNYNMTDMIEFVPAGQKVGLSNKSTTVKKWVAETNDVEEEEEVATDQAAAVAPVATDQADTNNDQTAAAVALVAMSPNRARDNATTAAAEASVPAASQSLLDAKCVPVDFAEQNAVDILSASGAVVPNHILARWKMHDSQMRVGKLFDKLNLATLMLQDVGIKSLREETGHFLYQNVPVKSKCTTEGSWGLTELFQSHGIKGRTTRARGKGMMFFFLMASRPGDVVWPAFVDKKRTREPTFSLSEQGRLVAMIFDPQNADLVTMLYKKWPRAEMDSRSGAKGVAHYYNLLAQLFNDHSYVPAPNELFTDHMESKGSMDLYNTGLVPVHRSGDYLRKQWNKLRNTFQVLSDKYNRSGMNESDITKYTEDLPSLLMFYTFRDTHLEAWACRLTGEGAINDAGDGKSEGTTTRHTKRKKVAGTANHDRDRLYAATVYESLLTKVPPEEEAEKHKERVRRAGELMDKFLELIESTFE